MLSRCTATGKVSFASYPEAWLAMLELKWDFKRQRDIHGRRIKHRQGRPRQKRIYYCKYCNGYHLTKLTEYEFMDRLKKRLRQ